MKNRDISELSDKKWNEIKHLHSPCKKYDFEKRTENVLEAKKIIEDLGIVFYLGHGVLLGAFREKDFIKYDDDVEFDVFEEYLKPARSVLREKLIKAGFIVRDNNKQKGVKLNIFRHKEKISIRGLYLEPKYHKNKYRLTSCFRYPRSFYKNTDKIEFKGCSFDAPNNIKSYLRYVYGSNWHIPRESREKMTEIWYKNNVYRTSKDREKWNK
jgi:phosphorylcholine metabolism protein LicD